MGNMGGASFNTMDPGIAKSAAKVAEFMRQCAGFARLRDGGSARK